MYIRKYLYIILLSCVSSLIGVTGYIGFTHAQENTANTQSDSSAGQADPTPKVVRVLKNQNNASYPSLFFTYWQHEAIRDVKKSRGFVRPPTEEELNNEDEFIPDRGVREIVLGGILYKDKDNWVIYLNNERVKPDSVPRQILDLKVFEQHIEIKWLDEYTNTIYPVRLKPHQRFNMDNRIFLSGE
ncbi:MAG: hypothetical protein OEY94_02330 [Alphaproteobacteria bacterium]|nr:hypothetical protein [Alphaproteobacteria bacterium]